MLIIVLFISWGVIVCQRHDLMQKENVIQKQKKLVDKYMSYLSQRTQPCGY